MPDSPPRSALRARSACVHTCVYGTCRGPSCYSRLLIFTASYGGRSRSPAPVYSQLAESSKDWTWTSTRSLTPVGKLESCSKHLRVLRERSHYQSGSTKRIPKRVRVRLSRTSRTDEAAEPHRLGSSPSRPVEKARKDAQCHFLSTTFLLTKTRGCHEFMPKTTRLATLRESC